MYYPEELIEEIQQKSDIVDVLSGYVHLQKKGSNYVCCCPFHNEKTPSFSVNRNRQMYKCFGCGEGGSVFTFIQKYENYTFPEAVKMLAERAGVELPQEVNSEESRRREQRRQRLLEVNKEAAKYFYFLLRSEQGKVPMEYITKRELSEETIQHFGIGYASPYGDDLIRYLKSKGFEDVIIRDSGLAGFHEKSGLVPKFWNRVMFPIQDINHRVIGFGGRVMGQGEPKYLNSPETEIFEKNRNLYGMNFARTSRKNHFIICEGYMDVISLHQAGFTQAVASLGTAFTTGHANLLRRYTKDVYLAYDSDGAGIKAALRAIAILREADISSKVIHMEPYKDPDELIKACGCDEFQKRIDTAENSFLFEIRVLSRDFDMKDPDQKTRFHKEIARRICTIEDEIMRNNYVEAVAQQYQIGYDNLRKYVQSVAMQTGGAEPIARPKSSVQPKIKPEDKAKQSRQLLLTWLAEEPKLYERIQKFITPKDFVIPMYEQVAERLFSGIAQGKINPAMLVSMFEDPAEQAEAANLFTTKLEDIHTDEERQKAFHDIVYAVKKDSFEYYSAQAGPDIMAINEVIAGKKALEELSKTHIFMD